MTTSDWIALLALLISGISLWQSLNTNRKAALLKASEKMTEIISSLTWSLMEARHLQAIIHSALQADPKLIKLPNGFETLKAKIDELVQETKKARDWARDTRMSDPVEIEKRKASALSAETQVKKISEMIKELPVRDLPK